MKFFRFVLSAAIVFATASSILHAENYDRESGDACREEARERYDDCMTLGDELVKNGPANTREYEEGNKLIRGKCKKTLDKDLAKCSKSPKSAVTGKVQAH